MVIRQIKSASGANPKQRATLEALSLGRIGATSKRDDTPQLQGQLHKVSHLVVVEEGD